MHSIIQRSAATAKLTALLLAVMLLFAGCATPGNTNVSSESEGIVPSTEAPETQAADEETVAAFEELCNDLFLEIATSSTINLHYTLADPAAYGIEDYEVTLGSWEPADEEAEDDEDQAFYDELKSIDRAKLDSQNQITYDILLDYVETSLDNADLTLYQEPLTTTSGEHQTLPILMAEYAFYSEQDVQDYLALIQDFPAYFETILHYEQARADAGIFMSDHTADTVISQCQDFLNDPENNIMRTTFADRIAVLELSEEQIADYTKQNDEAITNYAVPAYESLIQGLTALKDSADNLDEDVTGICSLPSGPEYYEYLLRSDVGTDKTPEELKDILNARMQKDVMGISLLYNDETTADMNDTSDLMTDPEEILVDLRNKVLEEFPSVDGTNYDVKYVPTALEDSTSPAFYLVPPMDHSDDNVIYINGKQYPAGEAASDLYSTLAHEGYPGHLLQSVYFNRSNSTPIRHLLSCSGYVEGWATYVEFQSYLWEDCYSSATANLMSKNQEATLCLYGLMDIGVNYEGWTQEELASFLSDYFDFSDAELAEATQEIFDLLVGEPANYLNYIVGCLEWQELRDSVEQEKGSAFSALDFHEQALAIGPCPFYLLKNYIR